MGTRIMNTKNLPLKSLLLDISKIMKGCKRILHILFKIFIWITALKELPLLAYHRGIQKYLLSQCKYFKQILKYYTLLSLSLDISLFEYSLKLDNSWLCINFSRYTLHAFLIHETWIKMCPGKLFTVRTSVENGTLFKVLMWLLIHYIWHAHIHFEKRIRFY